ncbi:YunG family protein [Paenibacillus sp. Marseille-Q7038]
MSYNLAMRTTLEILHRAWSIDSSTKWTKNNPAKGQCGVTSLVVNDYFGGDILKTAIDDSWHYYNRINDERVDFTVSQFDKEPVYQDMKSNRTEAFKDTNEEQYNYLKTHFKFLLEEYINNEC